MAIRTLEDVWAKFAFFCLEVRWVGLFISFATTTELTMVFRFMRTIAFDTLRSLNSARHSEISLFPTIFTLWNTRVHVSSSDSGDILSQISYLLVVILELSNVSEVQYKEIIMSSINKNN